MHSPGFLRIPPPSPSLPLSLSLTHTHTMMKPIASLIERSWTSAHSAADATMNTELVIKWRDKRPLMCVNCKYINVGKSMRCAYGR